MALDKIQLAGLKKLVRSDEWDVLVLAMADHIEHLNAEEVTGANAFETLRELHKRQGKVEGIKEFFDAVEKQNLD